MSRVRLRPTPELSADFNLEYDVNFKQFRRSSVFANLAVPRASLTAGWSRSVRLVRGPGASAPSARTRCAATRRFELFPKRLFLEGSADYDLKNDVLWQMRGQLRYAVQCCGFLVEYIRYNWNGRDEKQWRFNLELANVGSIGSFLGAGRGGGVLPVRLLVTGAGGFVGGHLVELVRREAPDDQRPRRRAAARQPGLDAPRRARASTRRTSTTPRPRPP